MANVFLSAFFIATGQDPAQVVEGSLGVTCIEARGPESVVASVYMPDAPLAAIGGGTALATQQEALGLLGIEPAYLVGRPSDPSLPGAPLQGCDGGVEFTHSSVARVQRTS